MIKSLAIMFFFIAAVAVGLSEVRGQGIEAPSNIDSPHRTPNPDNGRDEDLVFVQGESMKSALGWPIDTLRVGAIREGKSLIIPAQIDERDSEGRWVYTGGPEASKDVDKGLLDPNDELVFMAVDGGEQGDAWSLWPDAEAIDLITVTDPLTVSIVYLYLLRYSDAQSAPSIAGDIDYVDFDPKTDTIEGIRYIVGFPEETKVSYHTYIIKKEAGGSSQDLLDRFKLRLNFSVLWGTVKVSLDESDMIDRMAGWVDGPVRVLRKVKHSLRLFLGLRTVEVVGESSFYATYFEFHSQMDIPFELDALLTDAGLVASTDFNSNAVGMTFWSDTNRQGVRVDGIWSEDEGELDFGPTNWLVLSGPQGAWMNRFEFIGDLSFAKNLYYKDDAKGGYGPEDEPGAIGTVGYNFEDAHKIQKGIYRYDNHIYAPIGYQPGDETKYLNMVDNPLVTLVTPVPVPR